ncbi:hypothetical protein swp_0623 [Shewanella piezotolerans WP3]|uniref:Uncharacterized protein n=1 Tax=Shewanella piezotolerans (strain WP3 / JCM 13877) TaxID=225849 RepID=B8CIG9_SHEPW|nr:hypothetical protein swp_0623 [Shewanella piezotolerans WP3]
MSLFTPEVASRKYAYRRVLAAVKLHLATVLVLSGSTIKVKLC